MSLVDKSHHVTICEINIMYVRSYAATLKNKMATWAPPRHKVPIFFGLQDLNRFEDFWRTEQVKINLMSRIKIILNNHYLKDHFSLNAIKRNQVPNLELSAPDIRP